MKHALKAIAYGACMALFLWVTACNMEDSRPSKFQRMAYRVKPAVVRIWAGVQGTVEYEIGQTRKYDENNFVGSSGSGFIVNPNGYIVTNSHVVRTIYEFDRNRDLIENQIRTDFLVKVTKQNNLPLTPENLRRVIEKWKPRIVDLKPQSYVILLNFKEYPFEIKRYSKGIEEAAHDREGEWKGIAILKIEGKDLPTLKLRESDRLHLVEFVFAFGYPESVDLNFRDFKSKWSRVRVTRGTYIDLNANFKGVRIIRSDVAINGGNTGGPAIDQDGLVVGVNIYSSEVIDPALKSPKEAQPFTFLIPVSTLREFIRDAGVKGEPSLFDDTYHQALERMWARKLFEGRDLLKKALSFIPEQPDIQELIWDVDSEIKTMGLIGRLWETNSILVISLGINVILIVGIGVRFLYRRVKGQEAKT
jgi:S1-C subfamily serine protease